MKKPFYTAKAFQYEWYRFAHSPKFWTTILTVFLLLLVFLPIIYFFGIPFDPDYNPISSDERQEELQSIQDNITELYSILENEPELPDEIVSSIKEQLVELEFYQKTNSVPQDYMDIAFLKDKQKGRESAGFMIFFEIISSFYFFAVCVFSATFFFIKDYAVNNYKNIFVGTVKREAIFRAKLVLHLILNASVLLLTFIFGLSFGIKTPCTLLLHTSNTYQIISTTHLFFVNLVSMAVMGITLTSLSIIIGVYSKKPAYSTIIPLFFCLIMVLVDFTYLNTLYIDPAFTTTKLRFLHYLPITSLHYHYSGFNIEYLIKVLMHLAFSVIALILARRKFQKTI